MRSVSKIKISSCYEKEHRSNTESKDLKNYRLSVIVFFFKEIWSGQIFLMSELIRSAMIGFEYTKRAKSILKKEKKCLNLVLSVSLPRTLDTMKSLMSCLACPPSQVLPTRSSFLLLPTSPGSIPPSSTPGTPTKICHTFLKLKRATRALA